MTGANQSTKLNPVQIHLLKMFSRPIKENDLLEIKTLLSNYYAKKVDEESDKIWEEKKMSQNSIQELLNTHIRTPYK
jgi:S-adenosylmethionine synthetase